MGGTVSKGDTTTPSHLDWEETRQVTGEALQQKAALEDNPQREKTRSPEASRASQEARSLRAGEERGGEQREDIPFHGCALAPAQAKRGRFSVLSKPLHLLPCLLHAYL